MESPDTPLELTPWGNLTWFLFSWSALRGELIFCAWRANPLPCSLQNMCVFTPPLQRCGQLHTCRAEVEPSHGCGEQDRGLWAQPVMAPARPDPNNASHTVAPVTKCSFPSELSLGVSTLDGEFKAVHLRVGSVSLCCLQLTFRRNLWWSWEWILDQA